MGMDDEHDDGLGGRSRWRREVTQTARWGEQLVGLPAWFDEEAELPEDLVDAIRLGRTITSHGARRRQIATIDRILRDLDDEERDRIGEAIAQFGRYERAHATLLETWRTRLLADGDAAIDELVALKPDVERQRLRTLVRNASKEPEGRADRLLREWIAELFG